MGVRITNLKSPDQIVRYYSKKHTLESYYSENQEFNGYWGGKAAKLLGLEGYITDPALKSLAHNLNPQTGEQLTERMRSDRRPGYDITFDVPKSVSLAYAYSKDERIIRLVRQIVHDTMTEIEQGASTRVRAGLAKNADQDRPTENICSAEFIHLTARPENGYSDPHMHVHVVLFNLTMDPEEKKWKALQMGDIHTEIQYYQGAFHRRLKEGLEKMGLKTVPSGKFFEIEGIPRDLNDIFSRRTKKIEETAARLGITDPAQKAKLGAMTRDKKDKALLITDLEPFWWGGLKLGVLVGRAPDEVMLESREGNFPGRLRHVGEIVIIGLDEVEQQSSWAGALGLDALGGGGSSWQVQRAGGADQNHQIRRPDGIQSGGLSDRGGRRRPLPSLGSRWSGIRQVSTTCFVR